MRETGPARHYIVSH